MGGWIPPSNVGIPAVRMTVGNTIVDSSNPNWWENAYSPAAGTGYSGRIKSLQDAKRQAQQNAWQNAVIQQALQQPQQQPAQASTGSAQQQPAFKWGDVGPLNPSTKNTNGWVNPAASFAGQMERSIAKGVDEVAKEGVAGVMKQSPLSSIPEAWAAFQKEPSLLTAANLPLAVMGGVATALLPKQLLPILNIGTQGAEAALNTDLGQRAGSSMSDAEKFAAFGKAMNEGKSAKQAARQVFVETPSLEQEAENIANALGQDYSAKYRNDYIQKRKLFGLIDAPIVGQIESALFGIDKPAKFAAQMSANISGAEQRRDYVARVLGGENPYVVQNGMAMPAEDAPDADINGFIQAFEEFQAGRARYAKAQALRNGASLAVAEKAAKDAADEAGALVNATGMIPSSADPMTELAAQTFLGFSSADPMNNIPLHKVFGAGVVKKLPVIRTVAKGIEGALPSRVAETKASWLDEVYDAEAKNEAGYTMAERVEASRRGMSVDMMRKQDAAKAKVGVPVEEPAEKAAMSASKPATGATFKPTAEWQDVPEGAVMPAGMEYRMDLSTGKSQVRDPKATPATTTAPSTEGVKPTTLAQPTSLAFKAGKAIRDRGAKKAAGVKDTNGLLAQAYLKVAEGREYLPQTKAHVQDGHAMNIISTLAMDAKDGNEVIARLTKFVFHPEELTAQFGNAPISVRAEFARPVVEKILEALPELNSVRTGRNGNDFNFAKFLSEVSGVTARAAREINDVKPMADRPALERFNAGIKGWLGEFWFRNPGYILRNAMSDLSIMAMDGLVSHDGYNDLLNYMERFEIRPQDIVGGKFGLEGDQVGQASKLTNVPVIGKWQDAMGDINTRLETGRRVRAFYTGFKKLWNEAWQPKVDERVRSAMGDRLGGMLNDLEAAWKMGANPKEIRDAYNRIMYPKTPMDTFDPMRYTDAAGISRDALSPRQVVELQRDLADVARASTGSAGGGEAEIQAVIDKHVARVEEARQKAMHAMGDVFQPRNDSEATAVRDVQEASTLQAQLAKRLVDAGLMPIEKANAEAESFLREIVSGEMKVREARDALLHSVQNMAGDNIPQVVSLLRHLADVEATARRDYRIEQDRLLNETNNRIAEIFDGKGSKDAKAQAAMNEWDKYHSLNRSNAGAKDRAILDAFKWGADAGKSLLEKSKTWDQLKSERGGLDSYLTTNEAVLADLRKLMDDDGRAEFDRQLAGNRYRIDLARNDGWRQVNLISRAEPQLATDLMDVMLSVERTVQDNAIVTAMESRVLLSKMRAGQIDRGEYFRLNDENWQKHFDFAEHVYGEQTNARLAAVQVRHSAMAEGLRRMQIPDEEIYRLFANLDTPAGQQAMRAALTRELPVKMSPMESRPADEMPTRKAVEEQIRTFFGSVSDEQVQAQMAQWDALAGAWAAAYGRPADDWYATRFAAIVGGVEPGNDVLMQTVWHGSPHRFDQLDMRKIGSGEGNQAYGWGLYLAGRKEIAEYYYNALSKGNVTYKGEVIQPAGSLPDYPENGASDSIPVETRARGVVAMMIERGNAPAKAIEKAKAFLNRSIDAGYGDQARRDAWRAELAVLDTLDPKDFGRDQGALYKVDVPEDNLFLSQEARLNQQSDEVKKALAPIYEVFSSPKWVDSGDGKWQYRMGGITYAEITPRVDGMVDMRSMDSSGAWEAGKRFRSLDEAKAKAESDIPKDHLLRDMRGHELLGRLRGALKDAYFKSNNLDSLPKIVVDWAAAHPEYNHSWDRAVSMFLKDQGVVGSRYLDASSRAAGEGTQNYVLFDDALAKVQERFYQRQPWANPNENPKLRAELDAGKTLEQAQQEGIARGAVEFMDDDRAILYALQAPDISTLTHETGHIIRRQLSQMGEDFGGQYAQDYETAAEWAGAQFDDASGKYTWTTEAEEKFARGWEQYWSEGKAPTPGLQPVFERFKVWLANIYAKVRHLIDNNLTDEMRGVFDRLLTDQIRAEKPPASVEEFTQRRNIAGKPGMADLQTLLEEARGKQAEILRRIDNDQVRSLEETAALMPSPAEVHKFIKPDGSARGSWLEKGEVPDWGEKLELYPALKGRFDGVTGGEAQVWQDYLREAQQVHRQLKSIRAEGKRKYARTAAAMQDAAAGWQGIINDLSSQLDVQMRSGGLPARELARQMLNHAGGDVDNAIALLEPVLDWEGKPEYAAQVMDALGELTTPPDMAAKAEQARMQAEAATLPAEAKVETPAESPAVASQEAQGGTQSQALVGMPQRVVEAPEFTPFTIKRPEPQAGYAAPSWAGYPVRQQEQPVLQLPAPKPVALPTGEVLPAADVAARIDLFGNVIEDLKGKAQTAKRPEQAQAAATAAAKLEQEQAVLQSSLDEWVKLEPEAAQQMAAQQETMAAEAAKPVTAGEPIPGATWKLNAAKGGVELRFAGKPDRDVLDRIKASGFRWSSNQGVWYAKESPARVALAKALAGDGEAVQTAPAADTSPLAVKVDELGAKVDTLVAAVTGKPAPESAPAVEPAPATPEVIARTDGVVDAAQLVDAPKTPRDQVQEIVRAHDAGEMPTEQAQQAVQNVGNAPATAGLRVYKSGANEIRFSAARITGRQGGKYRVSLFGPTSDRTDGFVELFQLPDTYSQKAAKALVDKLNAQAPVVKAAEMSAGDMVSAETLRDVAQTDIVKQWAGERWDAARVPDDLQRLMNDLRMSQIRLTTKKNAIGERMSAGELSAIEKDARQTYTKIQEWIDANPYQGGNEPVPPSVAAAQAGKLAVGQQVQYLGRDRNWHMGQVLSAIDGPQGVRYQINSLDETSDYGGRTGQRVVTVVGDDVRLAPDPVNAPATGGNDVVSSPLWDTASRLLSENKAVQQMAKANDLERFTLGLQEYFAPALLNAGENDPLINTIFNNVNQFKSLMAQQLYEQLRGQNAPAGETPRPAAEVVQPEPAQPAPVLDIGEPKPLAPDVPPQVDPSSRVSRMYGLFSDALDKGEAWPTTPAALRDWLKERMPDFDPKDTATIDEMYDVIEGVNTRSWSSERDPNAPTLERLQRAQEYEDRLANRTRSIEITKRQQFSTPLTIGEGAQTAAMVRADDVVLEPNAGTASLIDGLRGSVKRIIANELDDRRVAVLRSMGGLDVRQGDALRLNLDGVRADVVVMNPPWGKFSTGKYGNAVGGEFTPGDVAERFVAQAMKTLPDGGRLVAVMPVTMNAPSGMAFRKWISDNHTLRAIIQSPPDAYNRRGTTVDSMLLVIDKGKHAGPAPVIAVNPYSSGRGKEAEALALGGNAPKNWSEYAALLDQIAARPLGATKAPAVTIEQPIRATTGAEPGQPAGAGEQTVAGGRQDKPIRSGGRRPAGQGRPADVVSESASSERPADSTGEAGLATEAAGQYARPEPIAVAAEPAAPDGAAIPSAKLDTEPAKPAEQPAGADDIRKRLIEERRKQDEAVKTSTQFTAYKIRSGDSISAHPRAVVETQTLSGVSYPELTYKPHPIVDTIRKKGWISDEQYDVVRAIGQANEAGHGVLIADGVGVGKSREIAGSMIDYLESGKANRILFTTRSADNVAGMLEELQGVAGTKFGDYKIINVTDFKEAKKQGKEYVPLPRADKAIYMIDSHNFAEYEQALKGVGLNVWYADEAHVYANVDGADVGRAWHDLHLTIMGNGGKVNYFTATPATDPSDLKYLYGLKEWSPENSGFSDFISRIKGRVERGDVDSMPDIAAQIDEAIRNQVGGDSEDVKGGGKGSWGKGSKDSFAFSMSLPEMEQVMREFKRKGKYISRELWRGGVEFEIKEVPFTKEQAAEHEKAVALARDIDQIWRKYSKANEAKGSGFGPRGMIQNEMKRRYFDMRLDSILAEADAALARGQQVVIYTTSVNGVKEGEGNLAGAINAINTWSATKDTETGEISNAEEIPEAVEDVMRLREQLNELKPLRDPIDEIGKRFGKGNVAYIIGETKAPERQKMMKDFQAGKVKVAVISDAGTIGISLHQNNLNTGRRHLIVGEFQWRADDFQQLLGRVDRSGQLSAPSIQMLTVGTAGERKFVATIANRMKSLGAIAKGQADSSGDVNLSGFELVGGLGKAAMNETWDEISTYERRLFMGAGFRDTQTGLPKSHPDERVKVQQFLLELQMMPLDDAKRIETIFANKYDAMLRGVDPAGSATSRFQGKVIRSTPITDDLTLHEVMNDAGQKRGILEGVVMLPKAGQRQRLPRIMGALSSGGDFAFAQYMSFFDKENGRYVSGMMIPPGKIQSVAASLGAAVQRTHSPETMLVDLQAGDKIPLLGSEGADYTLRMRKDGDVVIDGAKMAHKAQLMGAGAKFAVAGSYWKIDPENLQRFIERFPLADETNAAGKVLYQRTPAGAFGMNDPRALPDPKAMGEQDANMEKGLFDGPQTVDMANTVSAEAQKALRAIGDGAKQHLKDNPVDMKRTISPEEKKMLDAELGRVMREFYGKRQNTMEQAKELTNFSLTDYGMKRGFDKWLQLIAPFSYWYTRQGRNFAIRMMQDPALLAQVLRYKYWTDEENKKRGVRGRFKGQLRVPLSQMVQGAPDVYIDPLATVFPMAQWFNADMNDAGQANTAIQQLMQLGENVGLRPSPVIDIPLRFSNLLVSRQPGQEGYANEMAAWGRPSIGNLLPQTGAIQGITAAAGIGGPTGVDLESIPRKALGLPEGEQFDNYRISRSISDIAALNNVKEGTIDARPYLLAQEFVSNHPMDLPTALNTMTPDVLAKELGVQDAMLAAQALQIAREGARQATTQRGFQQLTSFFGGVRAQQLPAGEQARWDMRALEKGAAYNPMTGYGSREAAQAVQSAYPALTVQRGQYGALPGDEKDYKYLYDSAQRQAVNQQFDALKDAVIQQRPWDRKAAREIEAARWRAQEKATREAGANDSWLGEYQGVIAKLTGQGAPDAQSAQDYRPVSVAGATPREALNIRQNEAMRFVVQTQPLAEDFTNEDGSINFDVYNAAVKQWKQNLPMIAAGIPQVFAVLAQSDQEGRGGAMRQFLDGLNGDAVDAYRRRNDTALEAVQRAYFEKVYQPALDDFRKLQDTGDSEAYDKTIGAVGPMAGAQLLPAVQAMYAGRFTDAELQSLAGLQMPAMKDVMRANMSASAQARDDARSAFWQEYRENTPPGSASYKMRDIPLIAAALDQSSRQTLTTEQYKLAQAMMRGWVVDTYGQVSPQVKAEWQQARAERAQLDTFIASQMGRDALGLVSAYDAAPSAAMKEEVRKRYPAVNQALALRLAFAKAHPVYAGYYKAAAGKGYRRRRRRR